MPRPHPALSLGKPQVYAHRGGAALRPENTIPAFDHGLSLGADGLELDVHLSRDGVVVVHHDATLERTTNGRGALADLTADELARLDAGYRFSPPSPAEEGPATARQPPPSPGGDLRASAGQAARYPYRGLVGGVPTLKDVLRRYRSAWMIIELKVNDPLLAHKTIEEVRAADAFDRVAVGSFSTRVLRAARVYEPRVLTGASQEETRLALYRSWVRWPVRHPPNDAFQVPETSGATRVVSPRFVRYAHDTGVAVQVWTVNDAADMRRLLDWGVDGIISDRPDIAVEVVCRRFD